MAEKTRKQIQADKEMLAREADSLLGLAPTNTETVEPEKAPATAVAEIVPPPAAPSGKAPKLTKEEIRAAAVGKGFAKLDSILPEPPRGPVEPPAPEFPPTPKPPEPPQAEWAFTYEELRLLKMGGVVNPELETITIDKIHPKALNEARAIIAQQRERLERERREREAVPEVPPAAPPAAPEPSRIEPTPSPESAATAEELGRALEQARDNYIAQYRDYYRSRQERAGAIRRALGLIFKGGETPAELETAKTQYDEVRFNLARKLYAEKERELITGGTEASITELIEYRAELFEKLIVNERRQLQHQQIEGWPPKDKTLMGKCLEWWMKQGTYKRLLITSAFMTGAFALAPFISPLAAGFASSSGALMFGAFRFGRGAIGAISGQMIGKGVEKVFELVLPSTDWAKREKEISYYFTPYSPLEGFKNFEKYYEDILRKRALGNKIKNYLKWTAMWGGGYVASDIAAEIGAGWLEQWGRAPAKPAPAPRPAAPEAPLRPAVPETPGPRPSPMPSPSTPEVTRPVEPEPTPTPAPRPPAPETAPSAPSVKDIAGLAKVQPGEGAWHAVYRQLDEQLKGDKTAFAKRYGWDFEGADLEDSTVIRDILNRQTQHLLVENEFIKDGVEIRIAQPGTQVILDEKGKITIGEGAKTYEWTKPKLTEPTPARWPQGGVADDYTQPIAPEPEQVVPLKPSAIERQAELEGEAWQKAHESELIKTQGGGLKEDVVSVYGEAPSDADSQFVEGKYKGTFHQGALGENVRRYTLDLPDAKISLLDDLVYTYDKPYATAGAVRLAEYIKEGKLNVKDFARYYASERSDGVYTGATEQFLRNLENNFRIISEGTGELKNKAVKSIQILLNLLRQGRPAS